MATKSEIEQINKTVAEKGFAFLTSGQKATLAEQGGRTPGGQTQPIPTPAPTPRTPASTGKTFNARGEEVDAQGNLVFDAPKSSTVDTSGNIFDAPRSRVLDAGGNLVDAPPPDSRAEIEAEDEKGNQIMKDEITTIINAGIDTRDSAKFETDVEVALDEAPEVPNLRELFESERARLGLASLEEQGNLVDQQIEQIDADLASFEAEQAERFTTTGDIGGAITQERLEKNRIKRDLIVERNSLANQINTKNKTIETLINLTDMDFGNALQLYNDEFDNALAAQKAAATQEDRVTDNARASLTAMNNALVASGLSVADLDEATQARIGELELIAGLPVGFYASLPAKKENDKIISTTTRTDPDGNKFADVVFQDPETGEIYSQSTSLGTSQVTKKAPTEDSLETATDKEIKTEVRDLFSTEFKNKIIEELNSEQLREFTIDFKATQEELQQSLDPDIFFTEWKKILGIGEKKTTKATSTREP